MRGIVPQRTEPQDVTHLVQDDRRQRAVRDEPPDIGRIKHHVARQGQADAAPDEARGGVPENLPRAINRIELRLDQDVGHELISQGRFTRTTRVRRLRERDRRSHMLVDDVLPLVRRRRERGLLRSVRDDGAVVLNVDGEYRCRSGVRDGHGIARNPSGDSRDGRGEILPHRNAAQCPTANLRDAVRVRRRHATCHTSRARPGNSERQRDA